MKNIIIQIVALFTIVTGGIGYIAYLNETIQTLQERNTTLLAVSKHQDEVINELNYAKQKYVSDINRLDAAYKESKADRIALEEKLQKHDLDSLARLKPSLISKAMNNGTKNVLNDVNKAYERLKNNELSDNPEYKIRSEY